MKLTLGYERLDKAGKHNDRNFDVRKAAHIDPEKSELNRYWSYDGSYDGTCEKDISADDKKNRLTFEQVEEKFYMENFSDHIDRVNERLISAHRKSKVKTFEDYRKGTKTRPQDVTLYVGDMFDSVDGDTLWAIANRYRERFEERFGNNCKILNMALHMDEQGAPHVHIRRVWTCTDKYGDKIVGQTRGLDELGFIPPNPDRDESRYNNAMMSFTAMDRELARDTAEREFGITIEPDSGVKRKHLKKEVFELKETAKNVKAFEEKERELKKSIEKKINELDELDSRAETTREALDGMNNIIINLLNDPYFNGEYKRRLAVIRNMDSQQKNQELMGILKDEVLPRLREMIKEDDLRAGVGAAELVGNLQRYRRFVKEKGLEKEYAEFKMSERTAPDEKEQKYQNNSQDIR